MRIFPCYNDAMKKMTFVETGIVGLLVGFVVAAYLTFVTASGGVVANLLGWISLQPVIGAVPLSQGSQLIVSFIFYVVVYAIYGVIVGLILVKVNKPVTVVAALILVVIATGTEQIMISKYAVAVPDTTYIQQTAAVLSALSKPAAASAQPQQYFGMEAYGDLNGDGQSDVAFIIPRTDATLGELYYLAAAIASTTGHIGTNLLFLGNKIKPIDIGIENEIIAIDYAQGSSTTVKKMYANVENGNLEWLAASTTSSILSASGTKPKN